MTLVRFSEEENWVESEAIETAEMEDRLEEVVRLERDEAVETVENVEGDV